MPSVTIPSSHCAMLIIFLFFYEYARGCYALNGRVMCSRLAYLVFPFPISRATGSCTCMFPFPFHVFLYVSSFGLSTCLWLRTYSMFPPSSRRLVYAYHYFLRLPVIACRLVHQLVIPGLWLVRWLVYFLRIFVLVSRSPLYIWLEMGIRPSSSIYFATTLKVWPARSHVLSLVLFSSLAKATALRPLGFVLCLLTYW